MANVSNGAYALTLLCPIKQGAPPVSPEAPGGQSYAALLRDQLQLVHLNEDSPMAKVPNTYLCRFWVLGDVIYEGAPDDLEHLKSTYLVFSSNFHGDLETYLTGMWQVVSAEILAILSHCVGGEAVRDAATFIEYVKKCQVTTTFFFNGSNGKPLDEQLKDLYIRQEFTGFVYENQGKSAADLQQAFNQFVARTQPANNAAPTWRAGAYHLDRVVTGEPS